MNNAPPLKKTDPDPGRSGSGNDALGSAQQRLTNRVYQIPPATTIPNFDSQIEHEYWQRRATDSLCRALEFANSQQHISAIKATADYVTSLSRCLGIDVLKLITEFIQEQKGYRP